MDLATGAKEVYVKMSPFGKDGAAKPVPTCFYPLTGVAGVTRVDTNEAVFLAESGGVRVHELFVAWFARASSRSNPIWAHCLEE